MELGAIADGKVANWRSGALVIIPNYGNIAKVSKRHPPFRVVNHGLR